MKRKKKMIKYDTELFKFIDDNDIFSTFKFKNAIRKNKDIFIFCDNINNLDYYTESLQEKNYKITNLDFKDPTYCDYYNPFDYLENEIDVARFCYYICTKVLGLNNEEANFLSMLIMYIKKYTYLDDHNFCSVISTLRLYAKEIKQPDNKEAFIQQIFKDFKEKDKQEIEYKLFELYRYLPNQQQYHIINDLLHGLNIFNYKNIMFTTCKQPGVEIINIKEEILKKGLSTGKRAYIIIKDDGPFSILYKMFYFQLREIFEDITRQRIRQITPDININIQELNKKNTEDTHKNLVTSQQEIYKRQYNEGDLIKIAEKFRKAMENNEMKALKERIQKQQERKRRKSKA